MSETEMCNAMIRAREILNTVHIKYTRQFFSRNQPNNQLLYSHALQS